MSNKIEAAFAEAKRQALKNMPELSKGKRFRFEMREDKLVLVIIKQ